MESSEEDHRESLMPQPSFFQTIYRTIFNDNDSDMLPSSLPNNWPHSTEEDLEAKPKRLINIGKSQDYSFCNNFVKTSKYELYNFLPKFLLEEFNPKTKIANCYFLLVACLQCNIFYCILLLFQNLLFV